MRNTNPRLQEICHLTILDQGLNARYLSGVAPAASPSKVVPIPAPELPDTSPAEASIRAVELPLTNTAPSVSPCEHEIGLPYLSWEHIIMIWLKVGPGLWNSMLTLEQLKSAVWICSSAVRLVLDCTASILLILLRSQNTALDLISQDAISRSYCMRRFHKIGIDTTDFCPTSFGLNFFIVLDWTSS